MRLRDHSVASSAQAKTTLALTLDTPVPSNGAVRYLSNGNVPTSAAPVVITPGGTLKTGTIMVDAVDPLRDYILHVLLGGSIVESLPFPAGTLKVATSGFSTPVPDEGEIQAYLQRVTGVSSPSPFRNVNVQLGIEN